MNDIIVKTNNLKKYYKIGDNIVKALDGVNFEVKKQQKRVKLKKNFSQSK